MTYYPYFRGRMYDLLALKTLAEQQQLGPKIIPIIEPVRDSKELQQTVQCLIDQQQPFSVVANPQVSVYGLNHTKLYPLPALNELPFYHPSAILAADFSSDFLTTTHGQTSLLVATNYPLLKAYQHTTMLKRVSGVLIPDEARLQQLVGDRAILLTDPLTFRAHVADYAELTDEFFTAANWVTPPFGTQGYGDYSVVGSVYFDKGMPSRAIALHLIYVTASGQLRLHHFVSDSNDQMRGQKQKFFEALQKLVDWAPAHLTGLNATPALAELLAYQTGTKFPGLGIIKKLALMHHIQLIHRLLTRPN
ncbi:sce7725 family protein [Lactiplantibacillus sp. WILCCON 0030]|uniref:Sce7725 family protein n=1 Tax=Lactiplantibacillus brownii TaxID=3069269 RepID=A0ABU1A777_9LACO|nr:sce7725 family protein [Lactiplantibacillus brownii]MDQ7936288.1 sce7725 family protein [Lactiplantibacillus brownii]